MGTGKQAGSVGSITPPVGSIPPAAALPWDASLDQKVEHVQSLLAGSATAQFDAGWVLFDIHESFAYKLQGFETFEAFLSAKFPNLSRSWAYVLIMVARCFQREHAAAYGIAPLNEVVKLQQAVFPSIAYQDLLVGQHEFVGRDNVRYVLDFQADHSVSTLKDLVAAARFSVAMGEVDPRLTDEGKGVVRALQSVAQATQGLMFRVRDRRNYFRVELQVPDGKAREIFGGIARELEAQA